MQPIGVFDSGLGGCSVAAAAMRRLPDEAFLYLADRAHVPYGRRAPEEVLGYAHGIVRWFVRRNVKAVVVACNTATSAGIEALRASFPDLPFVGIEPALKVAVGETRSGVVGVAATGHTVRGERLASLESRFGGRVRVVKETPAGLVERIEAGETEGPAFEAYLAGALRPFLEAGIDCLVLGCTHYPLVADAIRRVAGPGVTVIDPSDAVARRLASVIGRGDEPPQSDAVRGGVTCYTTDNRPDAFAEDIRRILGAADADCRALAWTDAGELTPANAEGRDG